MQLSLWLPSDWQKRRQQETVKVVFNSTGITMSGVKQSLIHFHQLNIKSRPLLLLPDISPHSVLSLLMKHSKRNHGTNTATLPYLWGPDCCPHGLFAFAWKISKTYPRKLSCEKAQKSALLLEHNPFLSSQHCALWTNDTSENKRL